MSGRWLTYGDPKGHHCNPPGLVSRLWRKAKRGAEWQCLAQTRYGEQCRKIWVLEIDQSSGTLEWEEQS